MSTLSLKVREHDARKWLAYGLPAELVAVIERALAMKRASPKKLAATKARRAEKRFRFTKKSRETLTIKAQVFSRSGGLCDFCQTAPATDLEHAFGRGAGRPKQSADVCLATCRPCHRERTDLVGGAVLWWGRIAEAFKRHGCSWSAWKAAQVKKVHEEKDAQPAAPQLGKAVRP